ncbi:MAG: alpha/beta hydrolase [Gemmatimonadaceae bacterium]|jgi:phospholipase/carboxylesterase|nr:alpha/beta hydrolase [Gemmatimonadaceae bacterium]
MLADFIHIHRPPTVATDDRTLLLLHGTGGDEHDLLELGAMLAPGARLLSPRGRVLENGMPRFFRRLAEGVFDEADVVHRAGELAAFVREAAAHYAFDPARVVVVGFSNGANIAAATLLLHGPVFAAGVLLRAMVPLVPTSPVSVGGTRVLLAEGRMDPIVPAANAERLAGLLRDAGAAVTLHWSPTGHQLLQEDVRTAQAWLARELPPRPRPA